MHQSRRHTGGGGGRVKEKVTFSKCLVTLLSFLLQKKSTFIFGMINAWAKKKLIEE